MKSDTITLAKELRANRTEAETHLWQFLRARHLGGYKFRRQHPIGNYILDFYCPEKKLAVELDGGQHAAIDQMIHDQNRTATLAEMGIIVLRYWDHEVFQNTDGVVEDIFLELEKH